MRTYLTKFESLKEIKEIINIGNSNQDFEKNNEIIFK